VSYTRKKIKPKVAGEASELSGEQERKIEIEGVEGDKSNKSREGGWKIGRKGNR